MTEYVEIFDGYRPLLFSIAYNMLGSVMDAEDVVQEAFLRWRQVDTDEVQSPKSYLSTTVTRLCIDHLRSARVRRESYVGPWLPEPLLAERAASAPDTVALADSLSMAFLVLLESLNPVERAVFLLREVFDYDYAEIARIVGKSEVNCRQIASRARRHVKAQRPRFDPSPEEQEELTIQFMETCANGDMSGLVELLADEVTLWTDGGGKAVAALNPIHGAQRVAQFLLGIIRKAPPNLVPRRAWVNGHPGLVIYVDNQPINVLTLDITEDRIHSIHVVANPDKLKHVPALE